MLLHANGTRKAQHEVDVVLLFLLLTLNTFQTFFYRVFIIHFEQVNDSWTVN